MKFGDDKPRILKALEVGMVLHEDRTDQQAKNFVDSGVVSLELAHKIVSSTRGLQAKSSPHHQYKAITVWVLTPKFEGRQWYVKCYLIDDDLWLLSFHD